ncbi:MAG: hypothetical protein IKI21_10635, partial [Oscillospiraceae bacterium]|nr:hypothetical protein [Oscillospiraceae bacterium]
LHNTLFAFRSSVNHNVKTPHCGRDCILRTPGLVTVHREDGSSVHAALAGGTIRFDTDPGAVYIIKP